VGETAASENTSPNSVEGNQGLNLNNPTAATEGPEPLPAFLSLPLFLSAAGLETPETAPTAAASVAPAGVSITVNQPQPVSGTLSEAMPTAAIVAPQISARPEQVGTAGRSAARLESGGIQPQLPQAVFHSVAASATTVREQNVAKAEADPNSGTTTPKEKANLPALHSESGTAFTLAQTAQSVTAQVAAPAEPVTSPRTTDPESSDPAALKTGMAQAPAGQTQTIPATHSAPESVTDNAGTGVASMVSSMKNPQNTNNVAGPEVKVLPVGANGEAGEKNLPPCATGTPTRAAESRSLDWSFGPTDSSNHAPAVGHAQLFNVVDLPSLAEARMRALDRTHDMMALHAMRLVESKSDALSVVIKPAVGTELSLELRQRAGGVEAQATLMRGDREFLSQHWAELQQRLEQRGIKLSPLGGTADFFANDNGQFRQQQTSQEDAAQRASAFAEFAATVPAGGATARLAVVHDGWESWA
jgi:hypothetical protein